jgi:hypothetical protein
MDTPLLAGYVDESNEGLNEWQNKKIGVLLRAADLGWC